MASLGDVSSPRGTVVIAPEQPEGNRVLVSGGHVEPKSQLPQGLGRGLPDETDEMNRRGWARRGVPSHTIESLRGGGGGDMRYMYDVGCARNGKGPDAATCSSDVVVVSGGKKKRPGLQAGGNYLAMTKQTSLTAHPSRIRGPGWRAGLYNNMLRYR